MLKLKKITHKKFKEFRYLQWERQNKICPILKQKIKYKDCSFDHKHKAKNEKIGENGKGLLRGVLHFQANSWEGKVVNAFKRYGLHKFNISLPEALRNLADYIESPPMADDEIRYIHPDEGPKPKKLGKREYNRICKYYFQIYPKRKKLPKYPKSGKITKKFENLLELTNKLHNK